MKSGRAWTRNHEVKMKINIRPEWYHLHNLWTKTTQYKKMDVKCYLQSNYLIVNSEDKLYDENYEK